MQFHFLFVASFRTITLDVILPEPETEVSQN